MLCRLYSNAARSYARALAIFLAAQVALLSPFAALAGPLDDALPAAMAAKTKTALAAIDAIRRNRDERYAKARKAIAVAEAESLRAAAALTAAREGVFILVREDLGAGREAAAVFEASRESLIAAALVLSAPETPEEIEGRRRSAEALVALLRAQELSQKSAMAIEAELLRRSEELAEQFPEALKVGSALKAAGRTGRTAWLTALAYGDVESLVMALLAEKDKLGSLAPPALPELVALERAFAAYRALVSQARFFVWPSMYAPSEAGAADAAQLGAARALAALGEKRALRLLAAFERSPRNPCPGEFARRTLELAGRLHADGGRLVAQTLGYAPSEWAGFLELLRRSCETAGSREVAGGMGSGTVPSRVASTEEERVRALNRVRAELAALDASRDPALESRRMQAFLDLLERPELLALAASDERYASLFAAAGEAYGRLFDDARRRFMEAFAVDPFVLSAQKRLAARTAEPPKLELLEEPWLREEPASEGRRFFAVLRAGGLIIVADPERAGKAYARAFAETGGRGAELAAVGPSAFLVRYGIRFFDAFPLHDGRAAISSAVFPPYPEPFAGDRRAYLLADLEVERIRGGLR